MPHAETPLESMPEFIYLVYRYSTLSSNSTKFVLGVYRDLPSALERQEAWCNKFGSGGRDTRGVQSARNGDVTFVNRLPLGDCDVEVFTTRCA